MGTLWKNKKNYQVRQGRTWSRKYKSTSSSFSSSSSSSSSSHRFRIFSKFQDKFIWTFCRLFDNFLTTFWQLFDSFLTTFDTFLQLFLQLFYNFFNHLFYNLLLYNFISYNFCHTRSQNSAVNNNNFTFGFVYTVNSHTNGTVWVGVTIFVKLFCLTSLPQIRTNVKQKTMTIFG
jgi:hypothetical protein